MLKEVYFVLNTLKSFIKPILVILFYVLLAFFLLWLVALMYPPFDIGIGEWATKAGEWLTGFLK